MSANSQVRCLRCGGGTHIEEEWELRGKVVLFVCDNCNWSSGIVVDKRTTYMKQCPCELVVLGADGIQLQLFEAQKRLAEQEALLQAAQLNVAELQLTVEKEALAVKLKPDEFQVTFSGVDAEIIKRFIAEANDTTGEAIATVIACFMNKRVVFK